MSPVTPELLTRLLDAHADALELFAAQWSDAPGDAVQEAFVELARRAEVPRNARAWLYRVVRNAAISHGRAAGRRRRHESAVAEGRRPSWFQPIGIGGASDAIDPLDATDALRSLDQSFREVVVLRLWGELTFEDIGPIIGTSTSTAYRRYERAIALLRTRLGITCPNQKT